MNSKASMVVLVDQPPYRPSSVSTAEKRRYVTQADGSMQIGSFTREHLVRRDGQERHRVARPAGPRKHPGFRRRRSRDRDRDLARRQGLHFKSDQPLSDPKRGARTSTSRRAFEPFDFLANEREDPALGLIYGRDVHPQLRGHLIRRAILVRRQQKCVPGLRVEHAKSTSTQCSEKAIHTQCHIQTPSRCRSSGTVRFLYRRGTPPVINPVEERSRFIAKAAFLPRATTARRHRFAIHPPDADGPK